MMNKSRGASIAFIIFLLFLIKDYIQLKRFIKKANVILFTLAGIIFVVSAFIVSKSPLNLEEVDEKVVYVSTSGMKNHPKILPSVYDDYPILYFENFRVFSSDGNLNWRLQIWQDVIVDIRSKNLILIGYGYNFKIPAMTIDYRSGNDGTNENVHNFFINIFARGGAIHLILYLLFFGITYQQAAKKGNKRIYLMVFVPLIFTSF